MSAELSFLKSRVEEQSDIYRRCDTSVLPRWRRLLVQAWLSEVGLLLERLQRDVVQLEEGKPSQVGLRQAWSRYWQVFTALSPVAQPARADGGGREIRFSADCGSSPAACRLCFSSSWPSSQSPRR